ncbi:hypothetical protein ACP70R_043145 [Stipagrostis hirtigluma subsp. patula]
MATAGDGGSDAFADEAEPAYTIDEYIEGIEAEELEADLVLGGDDGKECTYAGGYLKRQAVFSCLTCVPDGVAGVCTACCLNCHDGHEGPCCQTELNKSIIDRKQNMLVVELWTKRKFRCDCGNSKFGGHLCKLCPEKDSENPANSYNHNFKGSYCTCGRPYPDPEAKEQVEMIQCCICEDWFHEDHIGLNSVEEIPRDEEGEPLYEDFICHKCSPICCFLKLYPDTIWAFNKQNSTSKADNSDANVMEGPSDHANINKHENGILTDHMGTEKSSIEDNCTEDVAAPENANLDSSSGSNCKLQMDINTSPADSADNKPFFMSKGWRAMLCTCETCTKLYAQRGIAYLIDKEDTIEEYEKIAKEKREKKLEEQEGAQTKFLSSLNHVQKIEIMSGINDIQNELQSFLASRDSSKPVSSDEVRAVFENLAKKKKQRLS